MDFIKKFFEEFKDMPQMASSEFNHPFHHYVDEGEYFTQPEKQYLQRIIADVITNYEEVRKDILWQAQTYSKYGKSYESYLAFKEHRKMKAELKKLVALQKKIKHSLIMMG